MSKQTIKGCCIVASFSIVLYLGLSNINQVNAFIKMILHLLSPFIVGVVIAFILNGVVTFFEKNLYARFAAVNGSQPRKVKGLFGKEKDRISGKWVRPVSVLSAYLMLAAIITLLVLFIIPQISKSLDNISLNLESYQNTAMQVVHWFSTEFSLPAGLWEEIDAWFQTTLRDILNYFKGLLPQMFDMVISVGGGVVNAFVGIVVSIYILLSKEKLVSQLRRLNRAFLPQQWADYIAKVGRVTVATFNNYVSGTLLDALVVGTVSTIGLKLFGFEYSLLIGVIMGLTNVIPFFGPFIGAVPGVLLTFMVSPMRAFWYIIFVLVVQQLDGNIISPRIIGGSVGLPPLWVLMGVTVGGGLFGIKGMVLGTPVCAVLYTLIGEATREREIQKKSPNAAMESCAEPLSGDTLPAKSDPAGLADSPQREPPVFQKADAPHAKKSSKRKKKR